MTRINPNIQTLEPAHVPDHLAGAVLQSLARPMGGWGTWRMFKTLIAAVFSFGILPLIRLPQRFREYIVVEQQQLWHLSEWIRLRSGHPEATELTQAANRLNFRPWLWGMSIAFAALAIAQIAPKVWGGSFRFDHLISLTYAYDLASGTKRTIDPAIYARWTGFMSVAFLFHWMQVRAHLGQMKRFISQFNDVARRESIAPISIPYTGWGFRPAWVLGMAACLAMGAFWGVPLMLAAGMQRRYVTVTSESIRYQLADRIRTMLFLGRPQVRVLTPASLRQGCPNPRCRLKLPTTANYCPRCGTRMTTSVNQVA